MLLEQFLKQNNYKLSEKGRKCILYALEELFPNLNIDSDFNNIIRDSIISHLDLKEEDALKVIQTAAKYAKLWMFS